MRIEPVVVRRTSEVLADCLRAKIAAGELPEGARLPSIATIAGEAGVSRACVNEALLLLRLDGLLVADKRSLSVVRHPGLQHLVTALCRVVRAEGPPAACILQMRMAIEPLAARLASTRPDSEDVRRLEGQQAALVESSPSAARFRPAAEGWRRALLRASGNLLLVAIDRAVLQGAPSCHGGPGRWDDPALRKQALWRFQSVIDAVKAGDGEAAEQGALALLRLEERQREPPGRSAAPEGRRAAPLATGSAFPPTAI